MPKKAKQSLYRPISEISDVGTLLNILKDESESYERRCEAAKRGREVDSRFAPIFKDPEKPIITISEEAWVQAQACFEQAHQQIAAGLALLGTEAWCQLGRDGQGNHGTVVAAPKLPKMIGYEGHSATRIVKGCYPLPRADRANNRSVNFEQWTSPRDRNSK